MATAKKATESKDAPVEEKESSGTDTSTSDESSRSGNDFVATETGEAPTAEDYLGDGQFSSDAPILKGAPHYYKGRLLTTQEELDAAREEEFKELADAAPDVIVSERDKK